MRIYCFLRRSHSETRNPSCRRQKFWHIAPLPTPAHPALHTIIALSQHCWTTLSLGLNDGLPMKNSVRSTTCRINLKVVSSPKMFARQLCARLLFFFKQIQCKHNGLYAVFHDYISAYLVKTTVLRRFIIMKSAHTLQKQSCTQLKKTTKLLIKIKMYALK